MTRSSGPGHPGSPSVTALLGPTNTGKTHRAVERMLGHRSGMIGLPLRLLAREVYDRVVAARGAEHVALVTGEEKIVPPKPRWWVCTVESMPVDRPVSFVAVDEIQLAADPERGHVFTDRLLRLRGVEETWFLGSDRIEGVLKDLVPTAEVRSAPRFSRLSYAGPRKLTSLPPRTAVVAFGVSQVYELAERLRARHGGVAVVMGALSPRVRNAQVALFQSGEVEALVATDAIGMGLNMDVHHVALAGLHKFDGVSRRRLRDDELAQIAGRAGRWRRDGTFGETAGVDQIEPASVDAIEQHRFAPITRLAWRNPDLDLSSPAALCDSLDREPPRRVLVPGRRADDRLALDALLVRDDVRARLGPRPAPAVLRLLWDVCGVPDFGNVTPEHHAALLAALFVELHDGGGTVSDGWIDAQVRRVARPDGDVDTLTARVAGIRVWTTVAHRPGWTSDPTGWQARTRAVEDALSDALHRRLLARFVDVRASVLVRRAPGQEPTPELGAGGVVTASGQPLGVLRGLRFEPAGDLEPAVLKAVWRVVGGLVEERLAALLDGPDGAFAVDGSGLVAWDEAPVAQLVPGADPQHPRVRLLRLEGLDGAQRGRLQARLDRWVAAWAEAPWRGLDPLPTGDAGARGLAFALRQAGGSLDRADVADALSCLSGSGRQALRTAGVRLGARTLWWPRALSSARELAIVRRAAGLPALAIPDDGGAEPFPATGPGGEALGFRRVEGRWVRVDVLEGWIAGGAAALRGAGVRDVGAWLADGAVAARRPARGRSREALP